MQLIDLNLRIPKSSEYEVVIIGGGTIGLFVAKILAQNLVSVCVLEKGDEEIKLPEQKSVKMSKNYYAGAEMGRVFGLGGTSNIWGGALIPFQLDEFLAKFPDLENLKSPKYLEEVELFFNLDQTSYECPEFFSQMMNSPFVLRKAKWPKFKDRNTWSSIRKIESELKTLDIYKNATFKSFNCIQNRVSHLVVQSDNRKNLEIRGKNVVIATGAIESTKILLELKKLVPKISEMTGQLFADHLSFLIGKLETKNNRKMNKNFGFRFTPAGSMENLRFEGRYPLECSSGIPFFLHFSFQSDSDSFESLRQVLQSIQKRKIPSFSILLKILKDLPWFAKAIWWRYVFRRVLYPSNSTIGLHCVVEMQTTNFNILTLGQTDQGNQLEIFWDIPETYLHTFEKLQVEFLEFWNASKFHKFGQLNPSKLSLVEITNAHGIFHPTGTTKIGENSTNGVVDENLKVFGLDNLYTVSTAILPNSGGVNPTLEALKFGAKLAEHLVIQTHQSEQNLF